MFIFKFIKEKLVENSPINSVAGAALVVSIAGVLSRLLGLLRDRILASQFGAGDVLDIYYASFRIPDLIYNLLVVGALSAAFIPVFTKLTTNKKEEEAWKLTSGLISAQVSMIVGLSIVLAIFAPYVMKIITPGFSEDKLEEVVRFTRIMFLSPVLLGVSAIFGGVLMSFKRFLAYSLAPIFYNIGIIIGAIFFVEHLGIIGLAWGVILGALMHILIQYPAVKLSGFKFHFGGINDWKDKNLSRVFRLMIPRSLAMGVSQINFLVVTIFASTLASGSLAVFNFANNIQSVPLGLFGISFAVAAFPSLSASMAKNEKEKFVYIFSRTIRRILFFVIPASVFIIMLRAEIVRIVFGGGEFDWEDTELTLGVLGLLSVSLFAQSIIPLLSRAFYAIEDTKTPFAIAFFTELLNIIVILVFIKEYQIFGLAIALSVSSFSNALLLGYFLRKKMGYMNDRKILNSVSKVIVCSIFSGLVIYVSRYTVSHFMDLNTFFEVFIQLLISIVAGSLGFVAFCYLLKVEEFHDFKSSLFGRMFGYSENK